MSSGSRVYCPECGAANSLDAKMCRTCGAAMPTMDERDQLWSTRTAAAQPAAAPAPVEPVPARRRGPGGCVLGCLGLLLILAVAAALFFFAVLPVARETARDRLRDSVATQVTRIDVLPVLPSGELVVTEADVNRRLRENIGNFRQVSDPSFNIDPDGVSLTVDVLGIRSTYQGGVAVENGRLVVTDPEVDGAAGQVLPADEVADFVEDLLNDLQQRSNVEFTDVDLAEGEMIIETTATGTPAGGTPAGL
ncbi:MAG: hypothetical protein ACR2LS_07540 [Thermomicrobiales bacterium]